MEDSMSSKEEILPSDISMRNGSVAISRGCQRNFRTEQFASIGDTIGFAKGKFRVHLMRCHESRSQDLVLMWMVIVAVENGRSAKNEEYKFSREGRALGQEEFGGSDYKVDTIDCGL